jgi:hypothetical protein
MKSPLTRAAHTRSSLWRGLSEPFPRVLREFAIILSISTINCSLGNALLTRQTRIRVDYNDSYLIFLAVLMARYLMKWASHQPLGSPIYMHIHYKDLRILCEILSTRRSPLLEYIEEGEVVPLLSLKGTLLQLDRTHGPPLRCVAEKQLHVPAYVLH